MCNYSTEGAIMGCSVETDLSRQLMIVVYTGDVGVGEVRGIFEKMQMLLADMRPGFRLLTDLTHLKSMDSSCAPCMKQIMDLCDKKGVAIVVRIVSDPNKDIGFNIMSLFHYTRAVVIVTCSNTDEAERALAD
jgi:anti-anti-sigma regulatory factor